MIRKTLFLLTATLLFAACQEDPAFKGNESPVGFLKSFELAMAIPDEVCGEIELPLLAGQHIDAGKVTVANDEGYLYIKVESNDGFQNVDENIKLWIGFKDDFSKITRRPAAGHFPYKVTVAEGVNDYTFGFPIALLYENFCDEDVDIDQLYIILHADVLVKTGYDDEGYPIFVGETAFGGEENGPGRGAWWYYLNYTPACCDNGGGDYVTVCQTETAFAGNTSGAGSAWWYYYEATVGGVQTIWAGQSINVGTVEYVDGEIIITLADGWELQSDDEAVKIQGYSEIPESRPAAGQFTTYKGTNLIVSVDEFQFYVIHLDVQKCELVPVESHR